VANSGERSCNVPEAYDIPRDVPYAFNWRVDMATGYRTHSVLAVPLRDASRRIQGVLQLINATDPEGQVVPFHPRLENVARAFAAYAAIAVRSARLEELSFKDPLTDGYNRRYLMLRPLRRGEPRLTLSAAAVDHPARPRRIQGHHDRVGPRTRATTSSSRSSSSCQPVAARFGRRAVGGTIHRPLAEHDQRRRRS